MYTPPLSLELQTPQETGASTGPPDAADQQGSEMEGGAPDGFGFAPILIVVAIFWFIVIMPQSKERKRRAAMLNELKKDDNIMTTGGMYGRVAKIDGDVVTVVVSDGVRMRFHRQAVQTVLDDPRSTEEAPQEATAS